MLASKTHTNTMSRLAICNIILQRVQASVPLSNSVQARLNATLFGGRFH